MPSFRLAIPVLAVAAVGAAIYFADRGDAAVIRNDSVAFELEKVFLEIEERTLAIQRALLEEDEPGLGVSVAENVSWEVPTPLSDLKPLGAFEKRTLGSDSVKLYSGRDAVVGAWTAYASGYRVISDVRFKQKAFADDQAWEDHVQATLFLEVRGVLKSGETVQDEVKYEGLLVRDGADWRVRDLRMVDRTLRLAPQRMFTQVTFEAGLEMHTPDEVNVNGYYNPDPDRGNETGLDYGGISSADVDGDGRLDIYVANAQGEDFLFLNKGDGKFEDATEQAGIHSGVGSRCGIFGDIDNDGDQDLFVTKATLHLAHPEPPANQLYVNDGHGRFTDVTAESGLDFAGQSLSATFLDYDLDGDLDLYVGAYGHVGLRPPANNFDARDGDPNLLYRNLGNGRFETVPDAAGAADTGWSYAVAVCDYDNDGWPDIYLANDYGANRLYRNTGAGRFEEMQEAAGVTDTGNGMGAAWADVNDDGRFDLYVSNMSSTTGTRIVSAAPLDDDKRELLLKAARGNSFFLATPDGTFDSVGEQAGVAHTGWAWHADFLDIDRDSDEDLFVVNGYITGVTEKDY